VRSAAFVEHLAGVADAAAAALAGLRPGAVAGQQARINVYLAGLQAARRRVPVRRRSTRSWRRISRTAGSSSMPGDGVHFDAQVFETMTQRVREHRTAREITLAQARDLFGTNRRYAQAALGTWTGYGSRGASVTARAAVVGDW
jgi:hypothetical protein